MPIASHVSADSYTDTSADSSMVTHVTSRHTAVMAVMIELIQPGLMPEMYSELPPRAQAASSSSRTSPCTPPTLRNRLVLITSWPLSSIRTTWATSAMKGV